MKNKFYGWLIAVFSLVLLHPSGLPAAGAADSGNNTPKTAEELLVCIRDFLTDPEVDGIAFVEKITGVSKANWGPVYSKGTGFVQDPNVRWEAYLPKDFKQPLSVPYRIFWLKLEELTHALIDIGIDSHQGVSAIGDPDYLMMLTPAIAQKILGPPDNLYVTSPRDEFSPSRYSLRYTYLRGRYEFQISFWAKGDNDLQIRRERAQHTMEQIRAERARRKLFENHKDFLAITMRLSRKK